MEEKDTGIDQEELNEMVIEEVEATPANGNQDELDDIVAEADAPSANEDLENAVEKYRVTGDEDFFNFVYHRYEKKIARVAWRMNDEDLNGELAIVLLTAIKTYDATQGTRFNTYFWKCVQNHIGTQKIRRSAKKRSAVTISLSKTFGDGSGDGDEVTLEKLISDDTAIKDVDDMTFAIDLQNFLASLKEDERICVKMILNDATLAEIGTVLDFTAPAIHVKLRKLGKNRKIRDWLLGDRA